MSLHTLRALPFAFLTLTLAGCGLHGGGPGQATATPAAHLLHGTVFGGQQPVSGSSIQLYTVSTTGDGSPSTALLAAPAISDASGNFSISGQYTCAIPSQPVYLTATGGNAGSGPNPALAMMTALGPCGSLTPSSFVQIDERTTVAAVAALAPYMSSITAIGSSSLDSASLSSAFTLATSLADPATGNIPGPSLPANATPPTALINTLADVLASCINSGGSIANGPACAQLFAATTESGASGPTNTVAALLNLMRDPTMSTTALFNLSSTTPPFQPQLTSAPSTWAVALSGSGAPAALTLGCDTPIATGQNAFTDYTRQQPQTCRHLTAADLPSPNTSASTTNYSTAVARTANQLPVVPPGFKVTLYAAGFGNPRYLAQAPNGDLFVSQPGSGSLVVLRGVTASGTVSQQFTYATGLTSPYGLAFYPSGANPQYLYVANTSTLVRFPYSNGDTTASAAATTLATDIPNSGNHTTRALAFTSDGQHLLVSVGSASNYTNTDTDNNEFHRADILSYTPAGVFESIYASGLRNPVGLVLDASGTPWTSVNERDGLGDNVPADYVTHVQQGAFYGWPWYYNGPNPEPRLPNSHLELQSATVTGDVLLQPHFAPLQINFYTGTQFPAPYRGNLFVASHGSWNKATRGGYELLRVIFQNGAATGAYEDFMTGFVNPDGTVWGRPAGVATGADGALYVADDVGNCIWRIAYTGS